MHAAGTWTGIRAVAAGLALFLAAWLTGCSAPDGPDAPPKSHSPQPPAAEGREPEPIGNPRPWQADTTDSLHNRQISGNALLLRDMADYGIRGLTADVVENLTQWDHMEEFISDSSRFGNPELLTDEEFDRVVAPLARLRTRGPGPDGFDMTGILKSRAVLIGKFRAKGLTPPKELYLLDHSVLMVRALLDLRTVNWPRVRRTADEAAGHWRKVRGDVRDVRLRDSIDTAMSGLRASVKVRDRELAGFSAEMVNQTAAVADGYFRRVRHEVEDPKR